MDKLVEVQEEKKVNKFQWFLGVIVVPALFTVTVALIVLTVAGVNVFEKADELAEKVPFLSSDKEKETVQTSEKMESQLTELKAQLKEREATLADLESEVESKDQQIEQIQLEKEQLERTIDDLTATQEENKRAFKDIVSTYETISAKKAAPIIIQMSDEEATAILSNISSDTLASIMEQMDPANAAKYTALLTNESTVDEEE
jgi:flagellar motility protein MotE (MotC chaperone)